MFTVNGQTFHSAQRAAEYAATLLGADGTFTVETPEDAAVATERNADEKALEEFDTVPEHLA